MQFSKKTQPQHIRDFIILMELSRALDLIYTNLLNSNNPLVIFATKQDIKAQQAATRRLLENHKRIMEIPHFERLAANGGASAQERLAAHYEQVEAIRAPALLEVAHTFALIETDSAELLADAVRELAAQIKNQMQTQNHAALK